MTLALRRTTNHLWEICGVLFLFCPGGTGGGGVEIRWELWNRCVGRKRSLYAKAITFLIQGPANTQRRGGRRRGQREKINTRPLKRCFLNVCLEKTSWSLNAISESVSPRDKCMNFPANLAVQPHRLHLQTAGNSKSVQTELHWMKSVCVELDRCCQTTTDPPEVRC